MPNQTVSAPYYFDLVNLERSKTLCGEIARNHGLSLRDTMKDYGYLKVDSDYSESFVSWDDFTDEYLTSEKNVKNPAYTVWTSIQARCYNPNSIGYFYYGERGVTIAPEWRHDFRRFASDILSSIGRKPERFYSINRINNDGHYVPGNIEWAAPIKQARNRTNTKITELSAMTMARLYKYYKVTGKRLKDLYNDHLAEDDSHKITKSWGVVYNACQTYCPIV